MRGAPAERKIVTILFADLVGFTALCERHDPEDVDALLREYYRIAREVIETYGGVVEKFIGDAVVGVFGVPSVHEDDAVRAVHTAFRLLERVPELPALAGETLQVRIGVNTGPAVIRLDVHPGAGEGFLVGDAVNTAARLQSHAPPMGIVVGARTRELSARAMVYDALPPATLKGKADAVPCFIARRPRGRTGLDPHQRFATPLVDREVELAVLGGLLDKAFASSEPQICVLVAEAGMGKSRLVAELARSVEDRPSIVQWRMGRCPSYGDGLTFWAVAEIVRAHLGVLESDDVATVRARLDEVLAGEVDREWLAARLLALLGFDSPPASRDENFAAWLRFIEFIARDQATVVVFEDLHWASEATLSFVEHVVEHARGAPLLVLATTRPELFDARPDLADRLGGEGSSRNLRRLDLHPLTEGEATRLVDQIGRFEGLSETRAAIVRRAAGNPLFAEELVRLLADTATAPGRTPDAALETAAESALPISLRSLIAARLDALEPEQKALLSDAAVVGQVFWTGAVAALDHGDLDQAATALDTLADRDLVLSHRDSSIAGESEYAFRHALIREVAYDQLPRAARAIKHATIAEWAELAERGGAAEVVAHHYVTALELAQAAGERELTGRLLDPAVDALTVAGDHALAVDVAA
ncbi:MAG TPA: adenylate/guanylate cyclase domain-containing protein, partial [Thermoleophilia bacterium]|nr:adenylate/guanylate cyclase domain-containing protein [Thermoleophilia bacterium]